MEGAAAVMGNQRKPHVNTAGLITIVACLVPIVVLFFLVVRTTANGTMVRAFYYDDFYYYAQIARNIRETGLSSFDGFTTTNGYQPLWMALLVTISYFVEVRPGAFFTIVYCVAAFLHVIGTIRLFYLLRSMSPAGAYALAAVVYFFFGLLIAASGMETALLFALFPFLAAAWLQFVDGFRWRNGVLLGVLATLLILTRLDAILLVGLLFASAGALSFFAGPRSLRRATGLAVAALVCVVPLGLYVTWNYLSFGSALPVSAIAKSLHTTRGISWLAVSSLIVPHNLLWLVLPTGTLILVLAALLVVILDRRYWTAPVWLGFSIFLFPPTFYIVTAWRSDWIIPPWYYYPLIFALPFSLLTLQKRWAALTSTSFVHRWIAATAAIVMAFGVTVKSLNGTTQYDEISFRQAVQMLPFAKAHPGVYAMGNTAGVFGFLLDRPLVQLEGLVSDTRMIGYISRSADLSEVLSTYGVRYYITVDVSPDATPEKGCWSVSEPLESGPSTPKLHGTFCSPPVFDQVSEYRGVARRLLVFDAENAAVRPAL